VGDLDQYSDHLNNQIKIFSYSSVKSAKLLARCHHCNVNDEPVFSLCNTSMPRKKIAIGRNLTCLSV